MTSSKADVGEWWSTVWSSAIGIAFGEPPELEAGTRLARRSSFDPPEIAPGSMTLRDGDWVAHLGLQQLDDLRWEAVLRTIAADPQLTAAVITGDLPVDLHGRAVALGCSLAPERRELGADCSCSDWHEPCRHVGALVALVSELIASDPWLLTMLRGRTRDQVVEAVRRVRADLRGVGSSESSDTPRGADPGQPAAEAFRADPAPLPPPLAPLRRSGRPVVYGPPPVDSGVTSTDLERLVSDAAERSFQLLDGVDDAEETAALLISSEDDRARIELSLRLRDP